MKGPNTMRGEPKRKEGRGPKIKRRWLTGGQKKKDRRDKGFKRGHNGRSGEAVKRKAKVGRKRDADRGRGGE